MNLENLIKEFGYVPLDEPMISCSTNSILRNMNSFIEKLFYKEPIFENTEMTIENLFNYKLDLVNGFGLNFSFRDEYRNSFEFEDVKIIDIKEIDLKNHFYSSVRIENLSNDILKDIRNGNLYFVSSSILSHSIMINDKNEFSYILFKNDFDQDEEGFYRNDENGLVLGVRLCKLKIKNELLTFEYVNNLKTIKFI